MVILCFLGEKVLLKWLSWSYELTKMLHCKALDSINNTNDLTIRTLPYMLHVADPNRTEAKCNTIDLIYDAHVSHIQYS